MYDDDGNYVVLPNPDAVAEPYFDGLRGEDVIDELDRLQAEAWELQWMEEQWHQDNSGWFKDY